jgi:hypothetical protein
MDMTVSASRTRRLNISQLILRAGQVAGVFDSQQPMSGRYWEQEASKARDFLQMEVDALASRGHYARFMGFYTLQLISGTSEYMIPDGYHEIVGMGAYRSPGSNSQDAETVVKSIPREEWQLLTAKESQSDRPSLYYPHLEYDQIVIYLWPTPSEAGTIRFQAIRNLGDTRDGAATLDVDPRWYAALMRQLAHTMAQSASLPIDTRVDLRATYKESMGHAVTSGPEAQPCVSYVAHPTQWSR